MRVWVEYPYDVGSPHLLLTEGGEKAVISADAARALLSMGIPDQYPGVEPPQILDFGPKLSKKAAAMLGYTEPVAREQLKKLFGGKAHFPRRQRA